MKKTFFLIVVLSILGVAGFFVFSYIKDSKTWKIEVTHSSINVREDHSPHTRLLGEVYFGDKYKVIDIYLEDLKFVWYKIKLDDKDKTIGWVASARAVPYVKELNNPDERYRGEIFIDYKRPVIKYFTDDYETASLKTITYDHLEIVEDSDYTIKHLVYFEEFPKDRKGPQYWIKYIVEDEFGNKSSKVQRIIFDIAPNRNELLDFKDI